MKASSFHARKQSRCMEPPVAGSCRNFVVAWYYDYRKQYCKIFLYGGCGGNENKFSSEMSCQQVCLPEKVPKRYCGAQPILSPCAGGTQDWYFHPHRRICLPYPTGRCGKKENNTFKSCVECMNRCTAQDAKTKQAPIQPEMCSKPWDRGPCNANVSYWYHDNKYHECKMFKYGGCRGNSNRFWTEKKCLERCEPEERRKLVCSVNPEPKPCNRLLRWWFFNPINNTCHQLPRGLCPSTPNSFLLCEKCMRRCSAENARESCSREYKRMEDEKNDVKQGLIPVLVAGPAGTPPGLPLSGSGLPGETLIPEGATQGSPVQLPGPVANVPSLPVLTSAFPGVTPDVVGPTGPGANTIGSLPVIVEPPHQTAGHGQRLPAALPAIPGNAGGAPHAASGPDSSESGSHHPVIILAVVKRVKTDTGSEDTMQETGMGAQSGNITNDVNGIKGQAHALPGLK
ncbi:papilin-like isoform X2 [Dermacentor silvarum]|uniref:papilin-like isoform X2 n=1 Tax=Dermacentor silvarum TaxID=543639 RepID=UPI002101C16A|nr:papilin-like isoform X2 [Dermacentor silvarum]